MRFLLTALAFLLALIVSPEARGKTIRLAVLGDSLTAARPNLAPAEVFTAVLEWQLRRIGYDIDVLNHGMSGDTTKMGLARVPALLADKPDIVLIELGANDGDYTKPVDANVLENNLSKIIAACQEGHAEVWLAGWRVNLQEGSLQHRIRLFFWGHAFNNVYPKVAEKYGAPLYPFYYEGVEGHPDLIGPDAHPNALGVHALVMHILPFVEQNLRNYLLHRR